VRLCGIDLSRDQIQENRRVNPWADWHVANLDSFVEFEESLRGRFDAVIASEVVEHLDRPDVLLRNALALARSGGRLLLTTQSGAVRETETRVGHRRHFSVSEIRDLLVQTGWLPEHIWNEGFPFHDLSKWYANRNPEASMARFGQRPYGWREDLVCLALRLAFRLNSRRSGAQLFAIASRPS
jgi:SAM-dependent methyltransferase